MCIIIIVFSIYSQLLVEIFEAIDVDCKKVIT